MGGNRRIAGEGEKFPTMTSYIPKALKERHQKWCTLLGVSQSKRVRKLLTEDCDAIEGHKVVPVYDFDEAKDLRLKWKFTEDKMKKLLDAESIGKRSAYEVMGEFAHRLGPDVDFEKDIEAVKRKLIEYPFTGRELFSDSTLETFIEYVEAVIERRKVEAEIKLHRRQQLNGNTTEMSEPEQQQKEDSESGE